MNWKEEFDKFNTNSDVVLASPERVKEFIEILLVKLFVEVENQKIVEYPKMKKVTCENAYIGGQMNMLIRIQQLKEKWLK